MGVNNLKILIAEDNRDIALVYRVALQTRNHHVVITDNGEYLSRGIEKFYIQNGRS